MQSSSKHSPVVVDANIAVWTVVPTTETDLVAKLFSTWRQSECTLYAPALWLTECTSAIRRYVHAGKLSPSGSEMALSSLFALEVTIVEANEIRCQSALEWAGRLGQSRAYDGFYVALAEEFDAPFYTADRRLANSAHETGAEWAHFVLDMN